MLKYFAEKNVSSFCNAAKHFRILYIESAKTVTEMTLNELVKLTTLWTTGPWSQFNVVDCVDIVWGTYKVGSLKSSTREM